VFKNLVAKIAGKWLARKLDLKEAGQMEANGKKWYQSKTIWSDVSTIVLAVVGFADAHFMEGKIATSPFYQMFLAALGAAGIRGRITADKTIG
jgi:hypothetical protein